MRAKYVAIALLVLLTGIWLRARFSESEEKQVRRRFDRLSEWVSKDSGETIVTAARKVRSIASIFAHDCSVVTEEPSLSGAWGREDIANRATQIRSSFTDFRLRFYDLDVAFVGRDSASALFTGRVTGWTRYQERVDESREVTCTLVRVDGEWVLTRIEVVAVLEK